MVEVFSAHSLAGEGSLIVRTQALALNDWLVAQGALAEAVRDPVSFRNVDVRHGPALVDTMLFGALPQAHYVYPTSSGVILLSFTGILADSLDDLPPVWQQMAEGFNPTGTTWP